MPKRTVDVRYESHAVDDAHDEALVGCSVSVRDARATVPGTQRLTIRALLSLLKVELHLLTLPLALSRHLRASWIYSLAATSIHRPLPASADRQFGT